MGSPSSQPSGCLSTLRFATTELELDDSTCGPFKIKPKDGGSCIIGFPLEAPNASEKVFAKLAKYKSREIELKIKQHAPAGEQQQSLDDAKDPAPAKKDAAADKAPADTKEGKGENWPFPGDKSAEEQMRASAEKLNTPPPQSATTEVVPEKPARRAGRRAVVSME